MMRPFPLLALLLLCCGWQLTAQSATEPLTLDTLARFESVQRIDFPADLPIDSGWFTLSADGRYAAVTRRDNGLVIFDTVTGEQVETYTMGGRVDWAALLDEVSCTPGCETRIRWDTLLLTQVSEAGSVQNALFIDDSTLWTLHATIEGYFLSRYNVGDATYFLMRVPVPVEERPVRVWAEADAVWLEVAAETPYVIRIPDPQQHDSLPPVRTLPAAPYADQTAIARNSRTQAPLAITSDGTGLVKRWNLETGTLIDSLRVAQVPQFSRINDGNTHRLALRVDDVLLLADFADGVTRTLAPLAAEPSALIVNPAGDLVLGVALDTTPVIVAWDATTGERGEIGTYRGDCDRIPDMVRLSADGTTLVIGCDAGLDVWRVIGSE
jgi:hypothetical protein